MPQTAGITGMIPRIREGDDVAAEFVWQSYFDQLVRFARHKLGAAPLTASDEEDVAISAIMSFWHGMVEHRFEYVNDREGLWKLLLTITDRKICAKRRHEYARKRDARRTRREGSFVRFGESDGCQIGLDQLAVQPGPKFAEMATENCHALLGCLDERSRQVALLTLHGYSTTEIAQKLGCVRRTVERKLERIRNKWSRMGLAPSPK